MEAVEECFLEEPPQDFRKLLEVQLYPQDRAALNVGDSYPEGRSTQSSTLTPNLLRDLPDGLGEPGYGAVTHLQLSQPVLDSLQEEVERPSLSSLSNVSVAEDEQEQGLQCSGGGIWDALDKPDELSV